MKKSTVDAYVLDDSSVIVLCGFSEGGGVSAGVYADGTLEDGLDFVLFRPSADSETAVFSNESITSEKVNGYVGLSLLKKVNFSVTVTAGTISPEYTYFIVPYEVTTATDNPDVYKNLVSILPLFALILLVAAAASLVYFKNKD